MNNYALLKPHINQDNVACIIASCGYEVDKYYKFKIRKDERTPSASISKNGYIKDFGVSFSGDIFAFLHEVVGYPKPQALQAVKYALGFER